MEYEPEELPPIPKNVTGEMRCQRVGPDGLTAGEKRIAELEAALIGIVDHWWEFGDMMIENKDDYGFSERIDLAAKLVK